MAFPVGPGAPLFADLPRLRLPIAWTSTCFLLTLGVYLAFVPRFLRYCSPPGGDQAWYMMMTASLAEDGDLDLHNNFDRRDEDKFYGLAPHAKGFVGMGGPYPLPQNLAASIARPPSEWYNYHNPGLSFLLLPFWITGGYFALWWPATIVFMCLVGALVAVNVLLLAYELTGKTWIAVMVWLPVSFSNPVMTFSYVIFTELLTGLMILYVFRRLALGWSANGPVRLFLVGACIGYFPWIAWRSVPVSVAFGLYAFVQWWRARKAVRRLSRGRPAGKRIFPALRALWLLVPGLLLGGLLLRFNFFLFGKAVPPTITPDRAELPIFLWPWKGMRELSRWLETGLGLLYDVNFGVLIYAPLYILAVVGLVAMLQYGRRSDRRLVFWMAAVLGPTIFLIMAFEYWHGKWNPPGRYQVSWIPLLTGPLAVSLAAISGSRAAWAYRLLYVLLSVPGFLALGFLFHDPRLIWPLNNGYFFEKLSQTQIAQSRDLRAYLPSIRWPDVVKIPYQTGWLLLASAGVVAASGLLLAWCARARRRETGSARGPERVRTAFAWLLGFGLVGLGWACANRDYLKPKTLLLERGRWTIEPHIYESDGIAYLNGKVYITEYGQPQPDGIPPLPGRVGVFDVASKTFSVIRPFSSTGAENWVHPGDVKVGPDGWLWVLNNGIGDQALLVMKPGGEIVRHLALEQCSQSCKGLAFGRNGSLFVSDQAGGNVLSFGPSGGVPRARFWGFGSGLNNPRGTFVDEDGTVYTSETYDRVQELDRDGKWIRTYELAGPPSYFATSALDPGWLDVGTTTQMVSIDRKTHTVQLCRLGKGKPGVGWLSGLAYGPERTLYAMDGSLLIEFEVHH
ncbi:MAG TPA: hypothetical protein VF580_08285 [Thermoanaerobaculia bacterium]